MARQDMLKESPNELVRREPHDLHDAVVGIVFVFEVNGVLTHIDDAMVANRDLVGVASEVSEHLLRPPKWRLCIDDPFAACGCIDSLAQLIVADVYEPVLAKFIEHLAAKDLRHRANRKEKSSSARNPSLRLNVERAARDNEVNVGVMGEGLSPSVQDCEES